MVHRQAINACFKGFGIGQIGDTNRAAANFIFIGRANTAPRGANFGNFILPFAGLIQFGVHRQYQRRVFCNHQVFGRNLHPLALQFGDLFFQMPWV